MNYLYMLWQELLILLGIGVSIKIKVSMGCNLHCSYCCVDIADGRRATWEELNANEWEEIVYNFPLKVRKVIIIGGEPFFYKHSVELIKKLIEKKIIVKVLTNGTYKRMFDIEPSPYYKLITTFHHEMKPAIRQHWLGLYKQARKRGYRILTCEIANCELSNTLLMPLITTNEDSVGCYYRRDFIFMPNGDLVQCIEDACSFEGYQPKFPWKFPRSEHFYSLHQKRFKRMLNILLGIPLRSFYHKVTGKKIKEW